MKAAPGAQLDIDAIFGREKFIEDLWQDLAANSVLMQAERRIGKTSVLHKMAAEPPPGWELVYFDLERLHSAAEFAEEVARQVHDRLTAWKKSGRWVQAIIGAFGGTQLGPIKFPAAKERPDGYWKSLLTAAVQDLVDQQAAAGKRVAFFFDEMPWMLAAIADPAREGEQTAMEVLDVLRALRQSQTTGRGFRMVLCGSVGLHHVLGSLRDGGYKSEPVNDMTAVELGPFDPPTAADLVGRLLAGEKLEADPGIPELVAEQTGGFPFYIHWVVRELRRAAVKVVPAGVEAVIKHLLTAPHDPCHFRHYRTRIDSYYPTDKAVVLAVLDHAARKAAPVPAADLADIAKAAGEPSEDRVVLLLDLLALDHYLTADPDGRYVFRHELIRRWWVGKQLRRGGGA